MENEKNEKHKAEIKSNSEINNNKLDQFTANKIGVIGSPSTTSEVTVDILETCFNKKLLGKLVFYLQEQEENRAYVIGQLTSMMTRNRWHEDMNFRPMVKRTGVLNHLSVKSDIKTALLTIQSSFTEDMQYSSSSRISLSLLGTSPTTSTPVYIVSNDLLNYLLKPYKHLLTYIGYIFETDVAMPTWFKHFGSDIRDTRAAGEAYHIGVFGKTGSGKSVLSAYILLSYAMNEHMATLFVDPQGQFSRNTDFGFDWHAELKKIGKKPKVINVATDLYLVKKDLFPILLLKKGFFRQLGIKSKNNQEYTVEELQNFINVNNIKLQDGVPNLLNNFLNYLRQDSVASRIYSTRDPRHRLQSQIEEILNNSQRFNNLKRNYWDPILFLFTKKKPNGTDKISVREIALDIIMERKQGEIAPFYILNISEGIEQLTMDEEIKTLYLGRIIRWIDIEALKNYEKNKRSNALVIIEEAQKFLTRHIEDEDIALLRNYIINGVKTHRKYGIGYMLITQNISSLDSDIISQLRIFFVGFGLVGADLARLKDILPDPNALEFYRGSFIDPKNTNNTKFPFMFFGPVSPLSFSGSPLFIHIFTKIQDFKKYNLHHYEDDEDIL